MRRLALVSFLLLFSVVALHAQVPVNYGSNPAAGSMFKDAEHSVIGCLENVYKGMSSNVSDSKFVNWPKQKWAKASYSFPNRGDIMRWGPKFESGFAGKLHFVGEHTCYAFTGYVEGALQSGFRLARKIVSRDGGKW